MGRIKVSVDLLALFTKKCICSFIGLLLFKGQRDREVETERYIQWFILQTSANMRCGLGWSQEWGTPAWLSRCHEMCSRNGPSAAALLHCFQRKLCWKQRYGDLNLCSDRGCWLLRQWLTQLRHKVGTPLLVFLNIFLCIYLPILLILRYFNDYNQK